MATINKINVNSIEYDLNADTVDGKHASEFATAAQGTKADNALVAKRDAVPKTSTLTELDAMRIQIQNIKQQYLKILTAPVDPKVDVVTVNRTSLCLATKLKTEEDIDSYVESLKEKLKDMLDGHDILHII